MSPDLLFNLKSSCLLIFASYCRHYQKQRAVSCLCWFIRLRNGIAAIRYVWRRLLLIKYMVNAWGDHHVLWFCYFTNGLQCSGTRSRTTTRCGTSDRPSIANSSWRCSDIHVSIRTSRWHYRSTNVAIYTTCPIIAHHTLCAWSKRD